MIANIRKFFSEVVAELKKVSWLTKKELLDSTWIVLFSSFLLGGYIALADFVLSKLLAFIIG